MAQSIVAAPANVHVARDQVENQRKPIASIVMITMGDRWFAESIPGIDPRRARSVDPYDVRRSGTRIARAHLGGIHDEM